MALTINTNIKNDADGYLIDAKNVKGTYVVVANYSDLANLPEATVVEGSLACVQQPSLKFYQYHNNVWVSVLEPAQSFSFNSLTIDFNNIIGTKEITLPSYYESLWSNILSSSKSNVQFIIPLNNGVDSIGSLLFNSDNGMILAEENQGTYLTVYISTILLYIESLEKQYVVTLKIKENMTPATFASATLSFQELQAGSGGGGTGTTKKWYEFRINDEISTPVSIANITADTASMQVKISEEQWQDFFTNVLSNIQAFSSLNTPQEFVDFYNTNISGVGGGGTALALLVPDLVDYAMGNQSKCQLVLSYSEGDGDGITLYPTSNIKGFGGTLSTTYGGTVYNWLDYITGSANSSMSLVETEETIGGGSSSGGTGSSRTLYHIEVADSNNHKAIIPIYKEAFDKYLVEMNQVGQQMATAMSITWTTLNTIDDVKNLFDTQKSTQLAYGCDLAMNLLVKYAYESGENPVLRYISSSREADIVVNQLLNYNLSTLQQPLSFPLGVVISFDYDPESIQVPDTTVGKTQNYYWFKSTPAGSSSITIDSNATFTYTEEQVSGGGSSGEGGSVELKSNVYTLKFSSNNTYEYTDSNEETQTTELPMIWGITFEAKDIVNRFNAIIDEFNSTSGTSIAHITSENEIATTIKQMITMMIAGNMNNIQFAGLFGKMLVYLANGEEQTLDETYSNSLNKLYRMFGTTCGWQDSPDSPLEVNLLANVPITIIYGIMLGGLIDYNNTSRELVQLDIQHTGDYTKFCLKDTYELELINEIPFEATGSSSTDPVSGGSGKLYMYDFRAKLYDYNGNEVLNSETHFRIGFYESNFERLKSMAASLDVIINTPQDLVNIINSYNATISYEDETASMLFLLLFMQADLKYLINNNSNMPFGEIDCNFVGGSLYINDVSNIVFQITDMNEGNEYYRGINTMNSCTLTEYGTSGSGSGGSTPSVEDKKICELSISNLSSFVYLDLTTAFSNFLVDNPTIKLETINDLQKINFKIIYDYNKEINLNNIVWSGINVEDVDTDVIKSIEANGLFTIDASKSGEVSDANIYNGCIKIMSREGFEKCELILLCQSYNIDNLDSMLQSYTLDIPCLTDQSDNDTTQAFKTFAQHTNFYISYEGTYSNINIFSGNTAIIDSDTKVRWDIRQATTSLNRRSIYIHINRVNNPERFSIAYNLVVNMNQQQYLAGVASWSGNNSSTIRQFLIEGNVATLSYVKALLSHLTGNPDYDTYSSTKPTPCFVFCTESNICWKLQYDGETNGLRAYKVNNFPFALKKNSFDYLQIASASNSTKQVIFTLPAGSMDETSAVTAMNTMINTFNSMASLSIPSYTNIYSFVDIANYLNDLDDTNYAQIKTIFWANMWHSVNYLAISVKGFNGGSIIPVYINAIADTNNSIYSYGVGYIDHTANPLVYQTLFDDATDLNFLIHVNELD